MGIALVSGVALMYRTFVVQFSSLTAPLAVVRQDSLDKSRDRAAAKFLRREQRWNPLFGVVVTLLEVQLRLVFVRFVWRLPVRAFGVVRRRPTSAMP